MAILKTMLMTWNDDQINRAWHLISEEGKRRRVEKNKRLKQNLKPGDKVTWSGGCLLYTSPSPRDYAASRMPSSA